MFPIKLAGLQKLTLLDYPAKTAATVFTPGCNLRCPFCQNDALVLGEPLSNGTFAFPSLDERELFALLEKRHGLLDGVCITGGEPTLQPDLADFCRRIRAMGFLVKLDTNGTNPRVLTELLDAGLLNYVAMDVKNAPARYAATAGLDAIDLHAIQRSMDELAISGIPYEFRTTVVAELHARDDLLALAEWLAHAPAWYLQSFRDSDGVVAGRGVFHAWAAADLHALLPDLQKRCPTAALRGIE